MKKKISAIFIAVLFVFSLFAFAACGGSVAGAGKERRTVIKEENIDYNLREFLGVDESNPDGNMGSRAPTSESERNAAEWLHSKFANKENYPDLEVTPLEDTAFSITVSGKERTSQNVEIRFRNNKEKDAQVVIGAAYDGGYGSIDEKFTNQKSLGAISNATGVATVMSIIDYVSDNAEDLADKIDFDIVFVFFGCGNYNSVGAVRYVNKYMTATDRLNTLAMFNIERLGGERVYVYSDETETKHEKFMLSVADENGLPFYSLPDNMPIIDGVYMEEINYVHFGMIGEQAPFFQKGIPVMHIFGGYYGGFNLSDIEMRGSSNLGGTAEDTYTNLKSKRKDYAIHGSEAATLLIEGITSHGFSEVMTDSRKSAIDYSVWVKPLWAYLTVIFAIVALCVVLIVLVKHFEKKYPFVPQIKRMKIAVFGMDYETSTDEDIFIDIKKPSNPFDGY